MDEITPYWRNPRKIPDDAVDKVVDSIRRYGFNQPLVLDRDGVLVAGHTRFLALKKMGATMVPCIVSDLPADQIAEYRIIDNKTHEATGWDSGKLAQEVRLVGLDALSKYFEGGSESRMTGGAVMDKSRDIPQEEFDRYERQRQSLFQDRAEERNQDKAPVDCPRCHSRFHVSKHDVSRRPV